MCLSCLTDAPRRRLSPRPTLAAGRAVGDEGGVQVGGADGRLLLRAGASKCITLEPGGVTIFNSIALIHPARTGDHRAADPNGRVRAQRLCCFCGLVTRVQCHRALPTRKSDTAHTAGMHRTLRGSCCLRRFFLVGSRFLLSPPSAPLTSPLPCASGTWRRGSTLRPRRLKVRDLTAWTIIQQDGPNRLGLWCNAVP